MSRRTAVLLLLAAVLLLVGAGVAWWLWPKPVPPAVTPDLTASDAPPPKHQGRAADRQESAAVFAFSPDGTTLATSDVDGTVLLSDATTGAAKLLLESDAGPVKSLAFSPDGKLLAAGGGIVTLWNVATGQLVATVRESTTAVAFSPNGETLAFAVGATVKLWDVRTRLATRNFSVRNTDDGIVTSFDALAFSPNGSALAARTRAVVVRWNLPDGKEFLGQLESAPGKWDGGITLTPDGVVRTHRFGWEQANGRPLALPAGVTAAALSPDGKTVAWTDKVEQKNEDFGFLWGTPHWRVAATADLGREWTWADATARLKDAPHRATRLEAIRWIQTHPRDPEAKDALPLIEDRLRHDSDWRVREKAALRLVSCVHRRDAPYPLALLEGFRDPDVCVRAAARYALMEYTNYPPGAVDDLGRID